MKCRPLSLACSLALAAVPLGAGAHPPPGAEAAAKYEVEVKRDLDYYGGAGADPNKHKLDLYLPKGKAEFPVVLFAHGGGWVFGDRRFFGAHEAVGETFARHGVGAAVVSYRLSPAVRHPEHVKDVARAFAWTYKNVKKYGGRPDRLFVCGHSAGGHLVALLSTDETYLRAEGLSLKAVRGVMPISGVFAIPDGLFTEAFGADAAERKKAGPRYHVRAGCPPFLIVYADRDYPFCDLGSEDFCQALKAKQVEARAVKVAGRNHIDVLTRIPRAGDPCARALLEFVAAHSGP
ncbi:MAG TPA: alpha/beta hydrolase [Gemmataceae bacterium]|nr:alpha/beta hydrolase [Gemmataceae bacterium]